VLILAAFSGAASARVAMEADATFERPTWTQGARVSAKDTIDVTFVLKTCPMSRAKLEAKVRDVFASASPRLRIINPHSIFFLC
jgi:hypothetical protein